MDAAEALLSQYGSHGLFLCSLIAYSRASALPWQGKSLHLHLQLQNLAVNYAQVLSLLLIKNAIDELQAKDHLGKGEPLHFQLQDLAVNLIKVLWL